MGIPFLADNFIFRKKKYRVNILSIPSVIKTIRKSLLDGSIWPDFTVIPNRHAAILNLVELKPGHSIKRHGCMITPYPVNHSVPATGFLAEDKRGRRFLYTGDTGPTEGVWKELGGKQIHCLIIETSFPNRMEEIAIRTGHLTPRLLGKELQKLKNEPEKIFVTHLKPQYFNTIRKELQKLKIKNLQLLRDGETINV
jgi:ribonuclease BN (tRNA processing enzyme)